MTCPQNYGDKHCQANLEHSRYDIIDSPDINVSSDTKLNYNSQYEL